MGQRYIEGGPKVNSHEEWKMERTRIAIMRQPNREPWAWWDMRGSLGIDVNKTGKMTSEEVRQQGGLERVNRITMQNMAWPPEAAANVVHPRVSKEAREVALQSIAEESMKKAKARKGTGTRGRARRGSGEEDQPGGAFGSQTLGQGYPSAKVKLGA